MDASDWKPHPGVKALLHSFLKDLCPLAQRAGVIRDSRDVALHALGETWDSPSLQKQQARTMLMNVLVLIFLARDAGRDWDKGAGLQETKDILEQGFAEALKISGYLNAILDAGAELSARGAAQRALLGQQSKDRVLAAVRKWARPGVSKESVASQIADEVGLSAARIRKLLTEMLPNELWTEFCSGSADEASSNS